MGTETKKGAGAFPLRLPKSTRHAAVEMAKADGLSLNHFISLAVVEKIARMEAIERDFNGRPALPEVPQT